MFIKKNNKRIISITTTTTLLAAGFIIGIGGWFGGGASIPADTFSRGLVAYYSFDEGSGEVAYDASNYQNHGTWSGTGSHWATGKIGTAGQFNGVDDYVEAADSASLRITGDITIEAWVYAESFSDYRTVVQKAIAGGVPAPYQLFLELTSGSILLYRGNGTEDSIIIGGAIPLNMWTHIIATMKDTTVKIYQDSVLRKTDTLLTMIADGGQPLKIGRSITNHYPFYGLISEVLIYNRALTPQEILDHYIIGKEMFG